MPNFQKGGVSSNSEAGLSFENLALEVLSKCGLILQRSFSLEIGVSVMKTHLTHLTLVAKKTKLLLNVIPISGLAEKISQV